MPTRIPVYNAATSIIEAFSRGDLERKQLQKFLYEKEQDRLNRDEKMRQFDIEAKAEQDRIKQQADWHKLQAENLAMVRKIGLANLKDKTRADLVEEGFPKIRANEAEINPPMINMSEYRPYADVGFPEVTFRGSEFPEEGNKQIKNRQDYEARVLATQQREDAAAAANETRQDANRIREDLNLNTGEYRSGLLDLRKQGLDISKTLADLKAGQVESRIRVGEDDNVDNEFMSGIRTMQDFNSIVPQKERGTAMSNLYNKGIIPLSKQKVDAFDAQEEATQIIQDIKALGKLAGITNSLNPISDYNRQYDLVVARIGKLRNSIGGSALGVLSNYDLARLERVIPNWKDSLAKGAVQKKIDSILAMHNESAKRLLRDLPVQQRIHFEQNRRLFAQ